MAESVVLITRKRAQDREFPVVPTGRSHFHRLIAKLPDGPFYTVDQVAWMVERKPKTVKKWIRDGKIERASKLMKVYGELVYLYTVEDVERFRVFAESQ